MVNLVIKLVLVTMVVDFKGYQDLLAIQPLKNITLLNSVINEIGMLWKKLSQTPVDDIMIIEQ